MADKTYAYEVRSMFAGHKLLAEVEVARKAAVGDKLMLMGDAYDVVSIVSHHEGVMDELWVKGTEQARYLVPIRERIAE
jgi:hypothetical protein